MNIYDIAKEAGVSIATVSRVLNNKGTVSAATRARVEAILKQNNYTPSAIARGMVSKSMRTVAVLTVDIRVPHYARTAYTIEREFSRRGYEVILCNTGGDRAETLRYLQAVNQKQADGIVLAASVFDPACPGAELGELPFRAVWNRRAARDVRNIMEQQHIDAVHIHNTLLLLSPAVVRAAKKCGVPVVLANGKLDLPNAYSVTVDDKYGVSLAVEHLVARGRKSIYYIKDRDTDSAKSKRDGFLEAMRRNGLEFADHVLEAGETLASGMETVQALLAQGIVPDGIVCGEDLTAAGDPKHRAGRCRGVQQFRLCAPV